MMEWSPCCSGLIHLVQLRAARVSRVLVSRVELCLCVCVCCVVLPAHTHAENLLYSTSLPTHPKITVFDRRPIIQFYQCFRQSSYLVSICCGEKHKILFFSPYLKHQHTTGANEHEDPSWPHSFHRVFTPTLSSSTRAVRSSVRRTPLLGVTP